MYNRAHTHTLPARTSSHSFRNIYHKLKYIRLPINEKSSDKKRTMFFYHYHYKKKVEMVKEVEPPPVIVFNVDDKKLT